MTLFIMFLALIMLCKAGHLGEPFSTLCTVVLFWVTAGFRWQQVTVQRLLLAECRPTLMTCKISASAWRVNCLIRLLSSSIFFVSLSSSSASFFFSFCARSFLSSTCITHQLRILLTFCSIGLFFQSYHRLSQVPRVHRKSLWDRRSCIFYGVGVLPNAETTVSRHWRQIIITY